MTRNLSLQLFTITPSCVRLVSDKLATQLFSVVQKSSHNALLLLYLPIAGVCVDELVRKLLVHVAEPAKPVSTASSCVCQLILMVRC